jgi:hypothetical protein
MSKILQLVSKTFKGNEFTHEFTAKAKKAKIILEEMTNTNSAHLYLKCRKTDVPIGSLIGFAGSGPISEHNLIVGEKYKITFATEGRQIRQGDNTYTDLPSSVDVSVVWEDE